MEREFDIQGGVNMKKLAMGVLGMMFVVAGLNFPAVAEQDVKGGKDHPLLSRMPDFHISSYQEVEFGSYNFIQKDAKKTSIEGRFYYLQYNLDAGAAEPGELKIRRNIQEALKKIGGSVIFDDNFNRVSTIVLQKDGKESWVEVRSFPKLYRLTIVEKAAMKQDVIADASAMGDDISSTGHVSIYGIYFDTGKSDLKTESDAALTEIAKLLTDTSGLKVYVVGHTDNAGSFDSNMKLSMDRANAVVKALIERFGVTSDRLKPYGVGSLAPVASNDTEEGKSKNRRVELVKQ